MKRILLLLSVLLLSTSDAFAQKWWITHTVEYKTGNDRHEWWAYRKTSPIHYRGEVDLGYSVGVEAVGLGRANIHTIHGVSIGRYLSTGVGTGVDIYHFDGGGAGFVIPVYLNLKGYLPVSRVVRPYLSFDVGGGFGVGRSMAELSGVICSPALGVQIGPALIQVGYALQQLSSMFDYRIDCHAIQFKVGVHF